MSGFGLMTPILLEFVLAVEVKTTRETVKHAQNQSMLKYFQTYH